MTASSTVTKDQLTVMTGIGPSPLAEGFIEGADIGKAELLGNVGVTDPWVCQPVGGLLLTKTILDRLVLQPFGCQPAT